MGILALLVLASVVARALAGLRVDGLWIAPDEMIYGSVGRNLWEHGRLSLFGEEPAIFGVVYPALVGGPLALAGLERGYDLLMVLQPLVMSATAVPVYFWARRLSGAGWALVAAALTLAVPGLAYSGLLMSEVAFYPAVVLAAWAIAGVLECPTALRQALVVGALSLAAATRLQALVLPAVLFAAAAVHALLLRDVRRPLRLWPSIAALAAIGAGWIAYRTLAAGSPRDALGAYAVTSEAGYSAGAVARFAAFHAADLLLVTGIFPLCAVALLVFVRPRSEGLSAYLATAIALVPLVLLQVGAFASEYVGRLAERALLPLAPVLFVGLSAWLARAGPRPRARTAVVVLCALALILYLPLRSFVVQEAVPDAFSLVPLIWLREHASDETLELVVWGAASAALALFALLPRRLLVVLPALVAGLLAFASFASTREVQQNVAFDQRNLLGGERGWVDRATNEATAYLLAGERRHNLLWHQLFWNERIRRVYVLADQAPPNRAPLSSEVTVRPDGALVLPDGSLVPERMLVAPAGLHFRGETVAGIEIREYEYAGLDLWRLEPPARLSWLRAGVRAEGDMHGPASLTAYDCASGRLELTLLWKLSSRVELRVNGELVRTLRFSGEEFVNTTVFPPPGDPVCLFEVIPDSLLGSTRFEFVRD